MLSLGARIHSEIGDNHLCQTTEADCEFLRRTAEPAIDLDMRLLATDVSGPVADFTADDAPKVPGDRWRVGRHLYPEGAEGVLYRRVDALGARCISVFRGGILGRSTQSTHYRFVWDGQTIKSVYDFNSGETFRPSEVRERAADAA